MRNFRSASSRRFAPVKAAIATVASMGREFHGDAARWFGGSVIIDLSGRRSLAVSAHRIGSGGVGEQFATVRIRLGDFLTNGSGIDCPTFPRCFDFRRRSDRRAAESAS
jgi:hypothetical protein